MRDGASRRFPDSSGAGAEGGFARAKPSGDGWEPPCGEGEGEGPLKGGGTLLRVGMMQTRVQRLGRRLRCFQMAERPGVGEHGRGRGRLGAHGRSCGEEALTPSRGIWIPDSSQQASGMVRGHRGVCLFCDAEIPPRTAWRVALGQCGGEELTDWRRFRSQFSENPVAHGMWGVRERVMMAPGL